VPVGDESFGESIGGSDQVQLRWHKE
jgi:hypothetical protein